MRTIYSGVEDLVKIMPELQPSEIREVDFGSYSREQFLGDLGRVTAYRTDPELAELLVDQSFETLRWMHSHAVRFLPLYGRQSHSVDGRVRFWGGLTVEAWGGGEGLVNSLTQRAQSLNIDVVYGKRIRHLKRVQNTNQLEICSDTSEGVFDSIVLACGGFESNAAWRARYLGRGWELARVRGTRFNTGDGLQMAIELGAETCGNWSGCHAVAWDLNAPEYGDLSVGDGFQKHSYPYGVVVNTEGKRFLDEGADFRNYTYARYGGKILEQPLHTAWQVFDSKTDDLLRDEYKIRQVTKVNADSLEELARKMQIPVEIFCREIEAFNSAIQTQRAFNPTVKDQRGTDGLPVPKSNWAQAIDSPPFTAYGVTCGITFTFGGLRINSDCQVMSEDNAPIPGLYAAGEIVGGLFYFNYPGGSGLTAGSVFGRRAGATASRA